jgi:hypothetical protein
LGLGAKFYPRTQTTQRLKCVRGGLCASNLPPNPKIRITATLDQFRDKPARETSIPVCYRQCLRGASEETIVNHSNVYVV